MSKQAKSARRVIGNTNAWMVKRGWRVSKRGVLSTNTKAASMEKNNITKDNKSKIGMSPYSFTGMVGKSRLIVESNDAVLTDADLHLLRTRTPWELGNNVFFSPEVFYKDGDVVSIKGSVIPARKKSLIVGVSFAVDTIAARAVAPTAMVTTK